MLDSSYYVAVFVKNYSIVLFITTSTVFFLVLLALFRWRWLTDSAREVDSVPNSLYRSLSPVIYSFLFASWLVLNISMLSWYSGLFEQKQLTFYLNSGVELGLTFFGSWFLLVLVSYWEESLVEKGLPKMREFEPILHVSFLVLKTIVYIVAILVVLMVFDLNELAGSIFTAGAVSTVVLGFAAREALSNVFSGAVLLFDQPFKLKDYIGVVEKEIEGTVEHIGWRVTRICTPDRKMQYVPNSVFSQVSIVNYTRMLNRRIYYHIGLRYSDLDRVADICRDIEQSFAEMPFVDRKKDNFATLSKLDSSEVVIRIRVFIKPCSFMLYNKAVDDFLHRVVKIVRGHNAFFAFPTTTLDADAMVAALQASKDAS